MIILSTQYRKLNSLDGLLTTVSMISALSYTFVVTPFTYGTLQNNLKANSLWTEFWRVGVALNWTLDEKKIVFFFKIIFYSIVAYLDTRSHQEIILLNLKFIFFYWPKITCLIWFVQDSQCWIEKTVNTLAYVQMKRVQTINSFIVLLHPVKRPFPTHKIQKIVIIKIIKNTYDFCTLLVILFLYLWSAKCLLCCKLV